MEILWGFSLTLWISWFNSGSVMRHIYVAVQFYFVQCLWSSFRALFIENVAPWTCCKVYFNESLFTFFLLLVLRATAVMVNEPYWSKTYDPSLQKSLIEMNFRKEKRRASRKKINEILQGKMVHALTGNPVAYEWREPVHDREWGSNAGSPFSFHEDPLSRGGKRYMRGTYGAFLFCFNFTPLISFVRAVPSYPPHSEKSYLHAWLTEAYTLSSLIRIVMRGWV